MHKSKIFRSTFALVAFDEKEPAEKPKGTEGAGDEGDGAEETVSVDKTEYNRKMAKLRKLETAERKRVKAADAEAARAAQEAADAAADDAEGDDDEPVQKPKPKAKAKGKQTKSGPTPQELKLQARLLKVAVQEDLVGRGMPASHVDAMLKLMDADAVEFDSDGDVDGDSLKAVIDETLGSYGKMFGGSDDGDERPAKKRRSAGPGASAQDKQNTPAGYLSPEEFNRTPIKIRYTPAFRARVDLSRPYWPTKISAKTFGLGSED
jgi:hypothetical protein